MCVSDRLRRLLPLVLCLIVGWPGSAPAGAAVSPEGSPDTSQVTFADAVAALESAYKGAGFEFVTTPEGVYALLDGERWLVQSGDNCPEAPPDSPQDPPLCALFTSVYPAGSAGRYPADGFDPGRVRHQGLLKRLYGSTSAEVQKNGVIVDFLGTKLLFNGRHGAAEALARVADRLRPLLDTDLELRATLFPLAGTFSWRTVKGVKRLSAHAFGIAIDLNVKKGLYWQWKPRPQQVEQTRQRYPQAIVDAFEAEGFIWGGKWSAFDFMHFEYRPELLVYRSSATSALPPLNE